MQGLGAPRFKPQPVWAADPAAEERNNETQCQDTGMSNFGQYCGEASLDMQIIAALTNGSVPSMYVGQNLEHGAWRRVASFGAPTRMPLVKLTHPRIT